MNPVLSVVATAAAFLFGGGTGMVFWRAVNRRTNAEGTDKITVAAERMVLVMESIVGRLETRVAALEADNDLCLENQRALSAEVARLGGNPALIVTERRRQHRLGDPDVGA